MKILSRQALRLSSRHDSASHVPPRVVGQGRCRRFFIEMFGLRRSGISPSNPLFAMVFGVRYKGQTDSSASYSKLLFTARSSSWCRSPPSSSLSLQSSAPLPSRSRSTTVLSLSAPGHPAQQAQTTVSTTRSGPTAEAQLPTPTAPPASTACHGRAQTTLSPARVGILDLLSELSSFRRIT